ncbi:MAG: formylglycine-generating enzyme family protein [Opitutaceae bacterium]|jgi:formylglycine-generating enzyme required for sulfatase activity|nr:formylglycine-generating enzyme family protein [Opitutaceae bacterium]
MHTQKKTEAAALLAALAMTGATAWGISINTVTIGGAGNEPDSRKMAWDGGTNNYGSVPYQYQIGTTDVTNSQYVEFLNAVEVTPETNTLGLYNNNMTSSSRGGIEWDGITGQYVVKPEFADKPVNYVTVYDAMRFTNWLTNGASQGASTETGAYILLGGTAIPANATVGRSFGSGLPETGTVWALPSEDEWYKAAYYSVADSTWSLYPNGSDSINGGDANYWGSGNGNDLVEAGRLKANPNGTYDMAGNVWEWNDTLITEWNGTTINAYGIRGGSYGDPATYGASTGRGNGTFYDADAGSPALGFRVVLLTGLTVVPEPGTYAAMMGLMALITGLWIPKSNRNGRLHTISGKA